MASTMFGERIQRNPFRARKKSGRSRTNALESMTPQGQALWASRNVCNAFGFIGPSVVGRVNQPQQKMTPEQAGAIIKALDGQVIGDVLIKGDMLYFLK